MKTPILYLHKCLIVLIIFQLASCRMIQTDHLDADFDSLIESLEKKVVGKMLNPYQNSQLVRAKRLRTQIQQLVETMNERPHLTGQMSDDIHSTEKFVQDNAHKLYQWHAQFESRLHLISDLIYQMSHESYEKRAPNGEALSLKDIALNESITFFALQYLREISFQYTNLIMPLALSSLHEEFDESDIVLEFRERLNQQYIALAMLNQVLDKDMDRTLSILFEIRQDSELPEWLDSLIEKNLVGTVEKHRGATEEIEQTLSDFTDEDRHKYEQTKDEYQRQVENVSLRYHPDLERHKSIAGVLSVLGNLSWGLVNTLIGGGIVVTTAIVSPFSRYVNFPRFRIASSREQIYVDVSGMSPIPGKMSLGLFELDNFAGYTYASGHEAGHARQSALLGPFYLPLILVSYAIQGHSHSFMEVWADRWAPGGHFHGTHRSVRGQLASN